MKKVLLLTTILTSQALFAFTGENDPKFFDKNYNHQFKSLPLSAELSLEKKPWASSYWPHRYGGIALRNYEHENKIPAFYNHHYSEEKIKENIEEKEADLLKTGHTQAEILQISNDLNSLRGELKKINNEKALIYGSMFFNFPRPMSKQEILNMSQEKLDKLSPAEKFDLYKGNYSLKLTNDVLRMTSPFSQDWEGICNGWSSASLEFHEPEPITVNNPDGVKINFYSSDLKALLSHYHTSITNHLIARKYDSVNRVGKRCKVSFPKNAWFIKDGKEYYNSIVKGKIVTKAVPEDCIDIDAGAFHIILANQIGKKDEGFVTEIARDSEVWNQPVYGYESEIISHDKQKNEIHLKTKIYFAGDGGAALWGSSDKKEAFYAFKDKTTGTENYDFGTSEFEYVLKLDNGGKIIGGKWLSYERPDFVWIKRSKGFIGNSSAIGIAGYMFELKNLVQARD